MMDDGYYYLVDYLLDNYHVLLLHIDQENPIFDKKWNIKTKKTFIIIVNDSNDKLVLGITKNDKVIEQDFVDGDPGQLWKKGKPDAEGYFSLEGSKSSKILTATSSSNLEVIGNHTSLNAYLINFH
jgi:hypothetical protein